MSDRASSAMAARPTLYLVPSRPEPEVGEVVVVPDDLSVEQRERRNRILDAAIELASEGGYESVQMRDVAVRSNTALGTVYRYYADKDHLLMAMWYRWTDRFDAAALRRPSPGATLAELVVDVFYRATRTVEHQTAIAEAVVRAAAQSQDSYTPGNDLVRPAVIGALVPPLDPDLARRIADVLMHVWGKSLRDWTSGKCDIDTLYERVHDAACLLLDHLDPSLATRDAPPGPARRAPGSGA